MNRIKKCFDCQTKPVLSVYFTAGYPSVNDTATIIRYLEESGADMIEIGIPFSDPLADGPVIQHSSNVALKNGMSVRLLFSQLENIRKSINIPLILMSYLNPVFQFGLEKFFLKCYETGIDGVILPDAPLDFFQKNIKDLAEKFQIATVLLITPLTSPERIKYIDKISSGFLYVVSSNSITGRSFSFTDSTEHLKRLRDMNLQNPLLTGFGIKDRKSFEHICQYTNGAIVGTSFIQHLSEHGVNKESIQKFIQNIRV